MPLQAPPGPARLPLAHTGLLRAPCGCCFDPWFFTFQWTTSQLPPPATATLDPAGIAPLPGAALRGPGGCGPPPASPAPRTPQGRPHHRAPGRDPRAALAPDPLLWLLPGPTDQLTVGHNTITGTATTAGTQPGSDIAPSPSADAPPSQDHAEMEDDVEVSEEELIREALRLFGYSSDTLVGSHEGPGSVPMPAGKGGEGGAVAPAPLELPVSTSDHPDVEGQPADVTMAGTATPAGASLGSDVPPSPSPVPPNQHLGDLADDLQVSEEELLREALRLLGDSSDTAGLSQDGASSVPVPGDPAGTGAAIPPCAWPSLSLLEELLSPDSSALEEVANAMRALEEWLEMGLEPQEPSGAAGVDLPAAQAAGAEQPGKKGGSSPLPEPPSKRRAPTGSPGVAGGH